VVIGIHLFESVNIQPVLSECAVMPAFPKVDGTDYTKTFVRWRFHVVKRHRCACRTLFYIW
jgi:hypothetical protein